MFCLWTQLHVGIPKACNCMTEKKKRMHTNLGHKHKYMYIGKNRSQKPKRGVGGASSQRQRPPPAAERAADTGGAAASARAQGHCAMSEPRVVGPGGGATGAREHSTSPHPQPSQTQLVDALQASQHTYTRQTTLLYNPVHEANHFTPISGHSHWWWHTRCSARPIFILARGATSFLCHQNGGLR